MSTLKFRASYGKPSHFFKKIHFLTAHGVDGDASGAKDWLEISDENPEKRHNCRIDSHVLAAILRARQRG